MPPEAAVEQLLALTPGGRMHRKPMLGELELLAELDCELARAIARDRRPGVLVRAIGAGGADHQMPLGLQRLLDDLHVSLPILGMREALEQASIVPQRVAAMRPELQRVRLEQVHFVLETPQRPPQARERLARGMQHRQIPKAGGEQLGNEVLVHVTDRDDRIIAW